MKALIVITRTAALCMMAIVPGRAADLVAEFTNTHEGWSSVSHTRRDPPWPALSTTGQNLSPVVTNGFLRVQDLDSNWQCIVAPASFLGNWQRYVGIGLGLVTDDWPTVYELVLFMSGSHDAITTNAAAFTFSIAGTPGSSRLDPVAPLDGSGWNVLSGAWADLLMNVEQFVIRIDLNDNVSGEVDLVDYIKLADSGDLALRSYRAVELEYFAVAGVSNQLQVSVDLEIWKNYGLPFIGDGKQHSTCVRLRDQARQFFRVVRTP